MGVLCNVYTMSAVGRLAELDFAIEGLHHNLVRGVLKATLSWGVNCCGFTSGLRIRTFDRVSLPKHLCNNNYVKYYSNQIG